MKTLIFIIFYISCSFLQSQNFWINAGLKVEGKIYSVITNNNEEIFCTAYNTDLTLLYRYINGVDNWELIEKEDDNIDYIELAIDKLGFLYTEISYYDDGWINYIARSTGKGDNWEIFNMGIIPGFDDADTLVYILGSNYFGEVFIQQSGIQYIYILTDDESVPWKRINTDTIKSLTNDITFDNNGNLYLVCDRWKPGGGDTNVVYKYDIQSNEFSKISTPILESFVRQIAVDNEKNIYVLRQYKWYSWPDNWYDVFWIEVFDEKSNSWIKAKKISEELVNSDFHSISDIIITKENDFYMSYSGGILKCNTSDFYFKDFNDGLPDSCEITCMHLSGKGYLYLGTADGEIYVTREPVTNVDEDNSINEKIQCYPNPTSRVVNIHYRIEKSSVINIFLVDVLGNQILIKSEYKFPGD